MKFTIICHLAAFMSFENKDLYNVSSVVFVYLVC